MNQNEDRDWMYDRLSDKGRVNKTFGDGVYEFLAFALDQERYLDDERNPRCPCRKCSNRKYLDVSEVASHLYRWGFVEGYRVWIFHGENYVSHNSQGASSSRHEDRSDPEVVQDEIPFETLVDDTFRAQFDGNGEEPNADARDFLKLLQMSELKLKGPDKKSVLQWVSEFFKAKIENNYNQSGCDQMYNLHRDLLYPEDQHLLPEDMHAAEKMMLCLGLGYETIDVCLNNCFLFYGEFASSDYLVCPECGEDRYETIGRKNPVPRKRLWYFPLAPRLKRLFMTKSTAEHMTWHLNCKSSDDVMIHPASGEAWRDFDNKHPQFAAEPRNIRLGLCTDGFTPFGNFGKQYSCWPVFVTPYNLPPDLCMREEFIFLSLIISGPSSPGQNINVLLRPLIDELKVLWEDGVRAYDRFREQNFQLRAALMWTISDFPAYGMLSQWSTHGWLSCPYCMENTKAFPLTYGRKATWWGCHRCFLPEDHEFRWDVKGFNGHTEFDGPPPRRTGAEMAAIVSQLPERSTQPGAPIMPGKGTEHNWTHKSIFWELPYWSTNLIRHNLDVMHCEKNFFDNIKNTVMDDPVKSKDNLKARRDLELLTTRVELFVVDTDDNKTYKPRAKYCLDRPQKKLLCQWLSGLRFPDGYASNIQRCVQQQQLKLIGMKSHDCHVFMQRLIPIAFRDFIIDPIWGALVEVSIFFRALCATEIRRSDMALLEESIVVTLCKLEKIFPPGFFDSMEHLAIHLPYEARVGGPVQYRWMYPFERQMNGLKKSAKNKARVEGSIANAYLMAEVTYFTSRYFGNSTETRYNRLSRNEAELRGDFSGALPIFHRKGRGINPDKNQHYLSPEELMLIELYTLMNCPEVDGWFTLFEDLCCEGLTPQQTQRKKNASFVSWFKETVKSGEYLVDERLYPLASGAGARVTSYGGYIVNGFRFRTDSFNQGKVSNCSGVYVKGSGDGIEGTNFYGTIKQIVEVLWCGGGDRAQSIVFFKCEWYDISRKGTTVHPVYKMVDINPTMTLRTNEPFIFSNQALQVFYTPYPAQHVPCRKGWWAVCPIRARNVIDVSGLQEAEIDNEFNQPEDLFQDDVSSGLNLGADLTDFDIEGQLADDDYELVEEDDD